MAAALAGGVAGAAFGAATALVLAPDAVPANAASTRAERVAPAAASELADRVAAIEARLANLELAPVATGSVVREPSVEASAVDDERIERLEATVASLVAEAQPKAPDTEEMLRRIASRNADNEFVQDSEATILDPAASVEEKMNAWRMLRDSRSVSDVVIDEMIRIGTTSADPNVRADVWRQADGKYRSTALVTPLLSALASDTSYRVRSEAAETLANYLDEPGVIAALELAASSDSSDEVRSEARDSLGKR
ncbi:MAG: HEAT repeat domain-containing protein [Planctomycetota bacterium]